MAGSSIGTIFRVTTWGESHGPAVGAVIDGVPAGLPLSEADIQPFLDRRKPGQTAFATSRKEADEAVILSGVFNGHTTGTPIAVEIRNTSQRSGDYSAIADIYRPGHADLTYDIKYGFRDYRGGGRSSGRETIGRVAAGAIAVKILSRLGVSIVTYALQIGSVKAKTIDHRQILSNPFCLPDPEAAQQAGEIAAQAIKQQDSLGGIIQCEVHGLPAGLGDPVFEKLDACLAKAIMSIGAVKGVEIGEGFKAAEMKGSENNDAFLPPDAGGRQAAKKATNHAGGILGGISDGSALIIRAAIKPTPSIFSEQQTINRANEPVRLKISGRHDPLIVPRAVVVVEAMTAITLADSLFMNMSSRMDRIEKFYGKPVSPAE